MELGMDVEKDTLQSFSSVLRWRHYSEPHGVRLPALQPALPVFRPVPTSVQNSHQQPASVPLLCINTFSYSAPLWLIIFNNDFNSLRHYPKGMIKPLFHHFGDFGPFSGDLIRIRAAKRNVVLMNCHFIIAIFPCHHRIDVSLSCLRVNARRISPRIIRCA